jgi:hypothetical protein
MPAGNWIVALEDGNYGTIDSAVVVDLTREGDYFLDEGGDPSYMTSQHFNRKVPLEEIIEFYLKNKRGG